MKINVPVIAESDVLIIGGTLDAIQLALSLKSAGHSIFIATPYTYFGEDVCGTLDLQSPKSDAFKALVGDGNSFTPSQIKFALDQHVINAGIDFLFQLRTVRPAYDANGNICGALFASRSGFHAVAAKTVIDATCRETFARSAGIETVPFESGTYTFKMYTVGGINESNTDLRITRLPACVKNQNNEFPVFEATLDIQLKGNTAFDFYKATTQMRKAVWHADTVVSSEDIQVDLKDGVIANYAPTAQCPVFLAPRATAEEISNCIAQLPVAQPVGFGETANNSTFDVVRNDTYFRFTDKPILTFDLNSIPTIYDCDVFIAGGGTGGAPATIGAARAGMRTVCAENLPALGGVMIVGRIGAYYHGNRVGFTTELDQGVVDMAPNPKYKVTDGRFDILRKHEWFLEKATEKGAEFVFDTMTVAAVMKGNQACGAVLLNPFGIGILTSKFVIDATGNADYVAASGAATEFPLHEEPAVQGCGISPIVLGSVYNNNDSTFTLDTDVVDCTRCFVTGRKKHSHQFDISTVVNSRERRRIVGDIVLQPYDFFANRIYSDTINIAYSNFDTHGYTIHPMFMVQPPSRQGRYANVPLRALLPINYEGMAATGLGVSAHRDCMPLIRMQADVQNQGYAMAYAAAMAIEANCSIRDIDVRELQKKLIAEDILPARVLEETDVACTEMDDDEYRYVAGVFVDPVAAIEPLKAKLAADPTDAQSAMILAFLGEEVGRDTLIATINQMWWDEGWNYRGMGQFGMSMSPLDSLIIALSRIGGDEATVLAKLDRLFIDSHFSHVRAVCLALMQHPTEKAIERLELILSAPEATGYAIQTFQDGYRSIRSEDNETGFRNSQLKEVYLAKALLACKPESKTARAILDSYINGMQGLYTIFAGA